MVGPIKLDCVGILDISDVMVMIQSIALSCSSVMKRLRSMLIAQCLRHTSLSRKFLIGSLAFGSIS